jgi:hypothetical protein
MLTAHGMEDDVSQNPDVNGLDKCPGGAATDPFVQPLTLTLCREAL